MHTHARTHARTHTHTHTHTMLGPVMTTKLSSLEAYCSTSSHLKQLLTKHSMSQVHKYTWIHKKHTARRRTHCIVGHHRVIHDLAQDWMAALLNCKSVCELWPYWQGWKACTITTIQQKVACTWTFPTVHTVLHRPTAHYCTVHPYLFSGTTYTWKLLGMLELIVGWLFWTIKHANKWLFTWNNLDNWKWRVICWRAWSSKIIILLLTHAYVRRYIRDINKPTATATVPLTLNGLFIKTVVCVGN